MFCTQMWEEPQASSDSLNKAFNKARLFSYVVWVAVYFWLLPFRAKLRQGKIMQTTLREDDAAFLLGLQSNKIQSDDLHETTVRYAEVTITSAELLALNATPAELVPAPGPGKVLEFISAVLILEYGSAAYANNGIISVANGTTVADMSDTVALADFLAKTADHIVVVQALSADVELKANESLVLSMATGESITGDSPVRAKVAYRVHTTGL